MKYRPTFFGWYALALIAAALLLIASSAHAATTSVTLAWDANTEPDLAGYNLYHADKDGGPYTLAGSVGLVTTWTHARLADGTHCWVATARDGAGNESGYSNQVCLQSDTTPPAAPGGLRAATVVRVP